MKNFQEIKNGPKDAATSKGPNAKADEAIASPDVYNNPDRRRKENPRANGSPAFAPRARARICEERSDMSGGSALVPKAAYRASDGRIWRYKGKKARVLDLLATGSDGVTQFDTFPWHTRLGGTIHAMRCDGLEISTELEGEFHHARYRLHTRGRLMIQSENSEGGHD